MPSEVQSRFAKAVAPPPPHPSGPSGPGGPAQPDASPAVDEILSLVADGVISTDEDGSIILFNRAAEKMFGYAASEVVGRTVEMLLPLRHRVEHHRHVLSYAEGSTDADGLMAHRREVNGIRKDGAEIPVEASLSRRTLAGRKILTVVLRDISERNAVEEHRRLVQSEMAHRFKNVMAVVNSIVSLTARSAKSVESFREALQGRLAAVARTQEVLLAEPCHGADLEQLLMLELAPFRSSVESNILLSGCAVEIPARSAASLALAFHELATNAVKYGALSRPGGRLTVTWRVEEAPPRTMLWLDWVERGGPPTKTPKTTGFGSELIARCCSGGKASLIYDPEGLRAHIEMPF